MSVISDLEDKLDLGFQEVAKELKKTNALLAQSGQTKADRAELEPLTAAINSLTIAVNNLQKVYVAQTSDPAGAGQPAGTVILRPA